VLSGANTYTGNTTLIYGTLQTSGGDDRLPTTGALLLSGGTLDLGGASHHVSGAVSFLGATVQNGTLVNNGADYNGLGGTISAVLAGTAGLTVSTGTLTLTGRNTYTGGTTVTSSGTLSLSGADERLPIDGPLTVSGSGSFNLGGRTQHFTGAVSFRDNATVSTGILSKSGADFDVQGGTISAVLAGPAGLTKSGAGTATLSGANAYTGGTTLAAGILSVSADANLGAAGGSVTFSGGVLRVTGTAITNLDSRTVNWATFNGGFDIASSSNTFTVNQDIGGNGALSKAGTGILVLGGANSYTGGTTVTAGTLRLAGGNDRLTPAGNLAISASTLDLGGGTHHVSGAVSLLLGGTLQNGTLIADGANYDVQAGTVNAVLGGTAGLTKSGTGTVTLSGANSYSGPTSLAAGTLRLSSGADRLPISSALTIAGGTLDLGATVQRASATVSFQGSSTVSNGTLNKSGADFDAQGGTISALLAGTAGLTKSGAGTVTLSAANTYTGATTVAAGTLKLSSGADRLPTSSALTITGGTLDLGATVQRASAAVSFQGSSTVSNGTLSKSGVAFDAQSGTISALLTGNAGLTKSGDGTVTLSAANNYSGPTILAAGTLRLSSGADRLPAASALTITGGTLDLGANIQRASATVSFQGSSTVSNGTLSKSGAAFDARSGTISALLAGTAGLTKSGDGTVTLSAANTYSGATTVTAGLLELSTADDRLPAASPLTVTGGTLDLGAKTQHTTAAVSFQGGTVQNGTLSKSGAAFDAQGGTISANLAGAAWFVKSGDGVLTLSGTNTYAGGTLVHQGTLQISDARAVPPGTVLTIDPGARVVFSNGIISASSSAGGVAIAAPPSVGPSQVPEPGTPLLLIAGAVAVIALAMRRRGRAPAEGTSGCPA
jgi:autotransporter-associated beta strand protein